MISVAQSVRASYHLSRIFGGFESGLMLGEMLGERLGKESLKVGIFTKHMLSELRSYLLSSAKTNLGTLRILKSSRPQLEIMCYRVLEKSVKKDQF